MSSSLHDIVRQTALVLETNNLRGGNDLTLAGESLQRLIVTLRAQTVALERLAQVVITHDGLPNAVLDRITALAGRAIDFVQIGADTGYYEAKNAGFEKTDPARCRHVVFGDADCLPDTDWLEQLLTPLTAAHPPVVVAGRTSYAATVVGTALTTIDFMYFPSHLETGTTANFYANNVVFERDVFERHHYRRLTGVYRAHCQVLGIELYQAGLPLHYAPRAHTEHRLPDTRWQAVKLRWMRGQDSVGLTPHLVRAYLPRALQWLGHSGPIGPLCILTGRLIHSLRALNRQALPPVRGLRWLSTVGMIFVFSTVDSLGALARGIGIDTVGHGAGDVQALSYHGR